MISNRTETAVRRFAMFLRSVGRNARIVHGDDSDENYMTFSERKKWESRPDPYANGGYPEYPGEYPDESDGGEE